MRVGVSKAYLDVYFHPIGQAIKVSNDKTRLKEIATVVNLWMEKAEYVWHFI